MSKYFVGFGFHGRLQKGLASCVEEEEKGEE